MNTTTNTSSFTVQEFADKFRALVGDETWSIPDDFIIAGINWLLNSLPSVPQLDRAFTKHYTQNLDANGHYRWKLEGDFRRLSNIRYLHFYTSTGGDPCRLKVCNRPNDQFYAKNGLIDLKVSGTPCEYTIEREGDNTYLVLDRPSNIPIIVDYIACGYPMPVSSMEDTVELSAVIENLAISSLRRVFYMEGTDFAFAGSVQDYLDNKEVVEALQMLYRNYDNEAPRVLGGV